GMRWSELDLDAGTWTLPGERSKNHRPLTLALPAAARAIIGTPSQGGRDHMFGVRASRGFVGWDSSRAVLDRRLDGAVKMTWKLHDIRRTVATGMAGLGVEPHHIEAVLNHYSGHRAGVAGVYNRNPYERGMKAALARWSRHVLALVEGRKQTNVISLHV